jgi:hypothetical protein
MGQYISTLNFSRPVNYDCPVCQNSGKLPNIAGRFFIINEKECKCNGCNSIFEKSRFFKKVIVDASPVDSSSQETKVCDTQETNENSISESKESSVSESNRI